jgi:hypothetical protein
MPHTPNPVPEFPPELKELAARFGDRRYGRKKNHALLIGKRTFTGITLRPL